MTPSLTTHGWPSSERSATAALAAWSSSSPMRTGPRCGSGGGLPGGGMAALRRSLHARLHARGGLLAARAPRGQDRLAGVPRARRHRDRHVPRGVRHVGGVPPESGGNPRGGRARRPGIPLLPAVALEAPAHQQCPGADQPRNKAQVEGGIGAPLDGIASASGRRDHARAGRNVAGVEVLLGVSPFPTVSISHA